MSKSAKLKKVHVTVHCPHCNKQHHLPVLYCIDAPKPKSLIVLLCPFTGESFEAKIKRIFMVDVKYYKPF